MTGKSSRPPILKPDETYTFRRYFELRFALEDILSELGANFLKAEMQLPTASNDKLQTRLPDLHYRLRSAIAHVNLTSEAARREALVAPILLEVANITEASINIEYPIEVNSYLKGDLDYYVRAKHGILVIEAKQADLTRGFTQLAAELIALDSWIDSTILYGAVTTGDIWQFGTFHRQDKVITQDLMLYRVPTDLESLISILVGILTQGSTTQAFS
jgi:hypothetical protein